ncbi:ephrin type-B receptor 6, partial [Clonorchis sinensis]
VNLMQLPETRAGHTSEAQFVKGQCIEGAVLKNLTAVFVESGGARCLPNGKWRFKMETECICQKGYEFLIGIGTCQRCPRGTYKQHTGNHKCSVCPLNSLARNYGQNRCECLPGYFRLSADSAESGTMDCY